jgi:hypothetical protein
MIITLQEPTLLYRNNIHIYNLFYISVLYFYSIFLFYISILYFYSIFLFYISVLYFCSIFLYNGILLGDPSGIAFVTVGPRVGPL